MAIIHGYRYHPLYRVWTEMKQRCSNKKYNSYKDYGGRGITVCDEWFDPKIFIEWCLSNGWKKGLFIDRRDNDGNYEPGNCRFITPKESAKNRKLIQRNNTSGYRGVSYDKSRNKYKVRIKIGNKDKHLGYFNDPKEAAIIYDNKAKQLNDGRPLNFKIWT